jgi:hypothetical protein
MAYQTRMTEKKLIKMISAGYGQGHGEDYRPWLKNTRSAISKIGTQSSGRVLYGLKRACDFKSRQEKKIARALLWLGAVDIREQFPLWPWSHTHPLVGAPGAEWLVLPDAPGLLEIAEKAAIPHGVFVGTNLPYVATTDFMVTVRRKQVPNLIAIACKDREIVLSNDPLSRPLERLELERLYSNQVKIRHVVVDSEVFGNSLLANLEWLMPDEYVVTKLLNDPHLGEFHDRLNEKVFLISIDEAIEDARHHVGWTRDLACSAFRYFTWAQELDIDPTKPLLMTQPAAVGGVRIRALLQQELFGEVDHA